MLFYRWFLPNTFGKDRYALFLALFPIFIVIYEFNARLASVALIHMPFIPEQYRHNLSSAHPENFTVAVINQNLGYTCLVLLAATSLYMVRQIYKNQHQLFTLENDKLRLELAHLKSQLQPHFFFNTLNNLYSLSIQGSAKTSSMIADMSGIMRYVLYESQQEKVSLNKELNFIKSYIELERIRHDDTGIIEFEVQGDTGSLLIEPLLFLPLIENAFKHSLAKDILGKHVKMILTVDADELNFQITNPKSDKTNVIVDETSGIGLTNIRKRLSLLYPGHHQLDVDEHGKTFTVFLTLRFRNEKK